MQRLTLTFLAVISLVLGVSAYIGSQAAPVQADTTYGAPAYVDGNPVGGGAGYSNIVDPSDADYVVDTLSELLAALDSATSGDIIFVAADIECTSMIQGQWYDNNHQLKIPDGVTLCSNRGYGGASGYMLWTAQTTAAWVNFPMFITLGTGARITGLRLYGSDLATNGSTQLKWSGVNPGGTAEVDNCEIYGFCYAGVETDSSSTTWIHHNYIHHNRRAGYGYGVEIYRATSCLIEGNRFDYSRHHISGSRDNTSWEARYNYLGETTHTQIDQHGDNDPGYWGHPAGNVVSVHHNTSTYTGQTLFQCRGVPTTSVSVYNNWAYFSPTTLSAIQEFDAEYYAHSPVDGETYTTTSIAPTNEDHIKMSVYDNWWSTEAPPSTNGAPMLNAVGNKAVVEMATLALTISATDPDGDTLTYSASNLPVGATFDPATRTFSWTPEDSQAGVYANIRFQVSDGSLSDTEGITITVSDRDQADVNSDGAVNSLDMIMLGQHWGETGASGWIPEDINKDGTVNVLDATLIGQHWTG